MGGRRARVSCFGWTVTGAQNIKNVKDWKSCVFLYVASCTYDFVHTAAVQASRIHQLMLAVWQEDKSHRLRNMWTRTAVLLSAVLNILVLIART